MGESFLNFLPGVQGVKICQRQNRSYSNFTGGALCIPLTFHARTKPSQEK